MDMDTIKRNARAKELLAELAKVAPDAGIAMHAQRMLLRTKVPMQAIIDKLPGDTMVDKAKAVKVSRQTLYYWIAGLTRPNKKQAKLIANITGYEIDEIRGRAAA